MRESFQKLVDWNAHQFDIAGIFKNGESAWEYLENHMVDIIITDINMPFMDGISLLEHVRERILSIISSTQNTDISKFMLHLNSMINRIFYQWLQ